jgi:hypothetical protein
MKIRNEMEVKSKPAFGILLFQYVLNGFDSFTAPVLENIALFDSIKSTLLSATITGLETLRILS